MSRLYHRSRARRPMLRRPPEPVWMALVAIMAVLDLTGRDALGLVVCLSFLTAAVLARPAWRLPLWILFVLAASYDAVLCFQDDRFILVALNAAIALHGVTELSHDARSVLHRQSAPQR